MAKEREIYMLIHTISEVREKVREWKKEGLTVGLVPTMGALHNGHKSLIEKSVAKCDKTVVSVFVNPIQFCPGEDLDKYPRTLDADEKLCSEVGADIVFAPSPKEMYGEGHILSNDFLTYVIPPYFYTDKLCGKSRVGHFDGVCTVVNKLFNIVQPDFAFFGEKDRQQLIILKKCDIIAISVKLRYVGSAAANGFVKNGGWICLTVPHLRKINKIRKGKDVFHERKIQRSLYPLEDR